MPFRALALPVMIASPGDVQKERDLVRSRIHAWNAANSIKQEVILLPVGWETHSAPDLAGRPQQIINERLLKDCDLLVGIFWTKLGTPTGQSASGTVEEIEEHLKAGKPAMVYFSSTPIAPDSVDAEQYENLKEFKSWCSEKGLYETYDSPEEFERKFSDQMQIMLSSNPYLTELLGDPENTTAQPVTPDLSQEAKILLQKAAEKDGMIMKLRMMGGQIIQTGNESFQGDNRQQAKWERGLRDLLKAGYVVGRGHKGEVFELTADGYDLADRLAAS